MAEKLNVLAPHDPWPYSSMADEDLQGLVDGGLLHPRTFVAYPEWLALVDEEELTLPAGYIISFVPFYERGLGVPTRHFMRALPHYYRVGLHNFNPNSIAQAAIFMAVCEGYLGIDLHWDLWLHLFRVEPFSLLSKVKKVRTAVTTGDCTL